VKFEEFLCLLIVIDFFDVELKWMIFDSEG